MPTPYPLWKYYPPRSRPPSWAADIVSVFETSRAEIDSMQVDGITSDAALGALRPGLVGLGFEVEASK